MFAVASLLGSLGAPEWKRLLSLVSPAFFRVVPLRELMGAVSRGVSQSRDTVAIANALGALPRPVPGATSGDAALFLYFRQILRRPDCLLDLTREAFTPAAGGLDWDWKPGNLRYVFEPTFRSAIAGVYKGFYSGDDAAFSAGLAQLGLAGCEDLFRAHFGGSDQSAVTFRVSRFIETFHAIFLECKARGLALQGDFVALGVALALLYEHLEKAGEGRPWDVRAAFLAALGDAPASPGLDAT